MPAPSRLSSARGKGAVALAVLVGAAALVIQPSGPNQAAHFALVRALADGTAEIDPGETIDASYDDGRFYAAKAPGLALFTLPWYGVLRAAGLQDGSLASETTYRNRLWQLALYGSVLPFAVLLVLVLLTVERLLPGRGPATALLLGAGTLLLPFATLFFDHALAAMLGFAGFAALLLAPAWPPSGRRLAVSGALCGLAVVVEFPLALVALAVGAFACLGPFSSRRLVPYTSGLAIGLMPLLVYNTWAFGSPLRLSYTNALEAEVGTGEPIVGANDEGFYGVGLPSLRAASSLLLSEKGLVIVAPLAIVALAGLPALRRAAGRRVALLCASVPAAFLLYNAAYYLPFGGQGPGPRFLVAALPFLALPLAFALDARPLLVGGVGLASAGVMALATLCGPLTGVEYGIGTWLERLGDGDVVETVPSRLGLAEVPAASILGGLVVSVSAVAVRLATRGRTARDELILLGGVLAGWLVLVAAAPGLVPADAEHGTLAGTVAAALLLVILATGLVLATRRGTPALLALAPALLAAAPQLDGRPRASLAVVAVAGALGLVVYARLRDAGAPRSG